MGNMMLLDTESTPITKQTSALTFDLHDRYISQNLKWFVVGQSESESLSFGTRHTESQLEEKLWILAERIKQLTSEEEDNEDWATKPTEYALNRALDLVVSAYQAVRLRLPSPYLSISSEGGIRIQWIKEDISLRLVIPSTQLGREYIYYETGEAYGTEDATQNNLTARFYWLIEKWPHGVTANP